MISIIFILVVSIIIFYYLLKKYFKILEEQKEVALLMYKAKNSKKPYIIDKKKLSEHTKNDGYTISLWIYMDDLGYNLNEQDKKKYKHILHKGDPTAKKCQPGIWFDPVINNLYTFYDIEYQDPNYDKFQIKYKDHETYKSYYYLFKQNNNIKQIKDKMKEKNINNDFLVKSEDWDKQVTHDILYDMNPNRNPYLVKKNNKFKMNVVSNIPFGRWFHLAIVVNGKSSTISIDGLVKNTMPIEADPKLNNYNIYVNTLNGGYSGLIAQIKYYSHPIDQNNIEKLYASGPDPCKWYDISKINLNLKKYLSFMNFEISGKSVYNYFGYGIKEDDKKDIYKDYIIYEKSVYKVYKYNITQETYSLKNTYVKDPGIKATSVKNILDMIRDAEIHKTKINAMNINKPKIIEYLRNGKYFSEDHIKLYETLDVEQLRLLYMDLTYREDGSSGPQNPNFANCDNNEPFDEITYKDTSNPLEVNTEGAVDALAILLNISNKELENIFKASEYDITNKNDIISEINTIIDNKLMSEDEKNTQIQNIIKDIVNKSTSDDKLNNINYQDTFNKGKDTKLETLTRQILKTNIKIS